MARYLLLGLLITPFLASSDQNPFEYKPSITDGLDVTIINNNNHTIQVHNERSDVCDCTPFFGVQFKECMNYVSKDCFKQNLHKIDSRICKKYVADLSMQEIHDLRASFTQAEWQELCKDCPLFGGLINERIEKELQDKRDFARAAKGSLLLILLTIALNEKG